MKAATYKLDKSLEFITHSPQKLEEKDAQLVLCFGAKEMLQDSIYFEKISEKFPNAQIVMGSTAGEIFQEEVNDDTITISALCFEHTRLETYILNISMYEDSFMAGKGISNMLHRNDLQYIFIVSDGSLVNGSELVKGLNFEYNTLITGGLAGDADRFEETLVGLDNMPESGNIVAIGFYGNKLKVTHGSLGGWEEFGLSRIVTKSDHNELFEVDYQNVLDLYKKYLGSYADGLPGSALLFPLSIQQPGSNEKIVRTILKVNNDTKSLVFAGDMPEGATVRFMKASFDNLISAATSATKRAIQTEENINPKLAILISCVGRKLVLGNRIDEEILAVRHLLPEGTPITGFYSYGEISPIFPSVECRLHNQTLTITLLDEEE